MGRALATLLLAVVAVGMIAMHQLAGVPGRHTHASPPAAAHAMLAADPGDAHCPDQGHCHPGQVCQPHPGSHGPDGVPALAPAVAVPAEPPLLTARTAASEAGDGSGCGPPGLATLSLLRI